VMSPVEMFLVCTVTEHQDATAIVGVAFTFGEHRKVSWFAEPVPLQELVRLEGPASETGTGDRLAVVGINTTVVHQPVSA